MTTATKNIFVIPPAKEVLAQVESNIANNASLGRRREKARLEVFVSERVMPQLRDQIEKVMQGGATETCHVKNYDLDLLIEPDGGFLSSPESLAVIVDAIKGHLNNDNGYRVKATAGRITIDWGKPEVSAEPPRRRPQSA